MKLEKPVIWVFFGFVTIVTEFTFYVWAAVAYPVIL